MKKLKLAVMIILGICVFSACGKKEEQAQQELSSREKNEVVIAIGDEPETGFDPCEGWGRYGSPLIQSTLVETDENMGIINDLSTGYTISQDGLVWTFQLREDAKFTDGNQVHARDVVFTFQTAQKSGSIVDLTAMKEVTATGEFTVEFVLNRPESAFIYTIAATGIVPEYYYDTVDYGYNPVGSGPFKLVQWDKGQQVILERNEDYYGRLPELKKVTILFLEEDAAFAAAKSGQLDVAITSPSIASQKMEGMNLVTLKSIDNRGLTLPMVAAENKLTDDGCPIGNDVTSNEAIRKALSYGIDREGLVKNVLNGYGRPAYSECDGMPWSSDEAYVEYDKQYAINLLEDAGWKIAGDDLIREKNGVKAQFTLLYGAGDSTRQALSEAVKLEANSLGIEIQVKGASWDEIDKRMYQDAVMMGWGAQNPNETYLLYHSDNMGRDYYNPEFYSSQQTDEYINQALSSMDIEKSNEFWKKVQWDGVTGVSTKGDCPWVWLVNLDHIYYVREGLDIGVQKIHPHGHAWPLAANLKQWKWQEADGSSK